MYHRLMARRARVDDTIAELRAQFPAVPERILAEVLHGYVERGATLAGAAAATRHRINDACAVA